MKSLSGIVFNAPTQMKFFQISMFALLLLCSTSCVNKITDDELPPEIAKADSKLTIITRTGAADVIISYPVHLYVFNATTQKCVEKKTLNESDVKASFKLPAGRYTILAFAGATEEKYDLPTVEGAALETVIKLKEGASHADLMTDRQNVTLEEKESNQVSIALKRKVMLLSSVVVKNLPEELTTVSLTVGPLYEGIQLNGQFTTAASGQHTVELTKGSDGTTWSIPTETYLLPGNATANIKITTVSETGGKQSYTFSSQEKMEANYKLKIEGRFTPDSGIILNGTVSGDKWAGSKDIIFSFDDAGNSKEETGGETPDEGNTTGEIPTVGDTYKGCYVLSVDKASESKTTVTLVALKKWENIAKADAKTTAGACSIAGINGTWRLPTEAEAKLLCTPSNFAGINAAFAAAGVSGLTAAESCFYDTGNEVYAFFPGEVIFRSNAFTPTTNVLALTTITLQQS